MRRNGRKAGKAIATLGLCVVSLGALATNLAAQGRRGAEVAVEQKSSITARGELVAVKKDSVVLLTTGDQRDITINVSDIRSITVYKNPKILEDAGLGVLIGGGVGAIAGAASGNGRFFGFRNVSSGNKALGLGLIGGGVGLVGGLIFGVVSSHEERIQVEGKSSPAIQGILARLSPKARGSVCGPGLISWAGRTASGIRS